MYVQATYRRSIPAVESPADSQTPACGVQSTNGWTLNAEPTITETYPVTTGYTVPTPSLQSTHSLGPTGPKAQSSARFVMLESEFARIAASLENVGLEKLNFF